MLTRTEVLAAFREFQDVVKAWEDAEGPQVEHQGSVTKAISLDVQQAADKLFAACDTLDVADDAKEIVMAIDLFDDALARWAGMCQRNINTDPQGGPAVWRHFEAILKAIEARPLRKIEHVGVLIAQGVAHAQIAKIYGWLDDGGGPDIAKVLQESAQPGRHTGDGFVHPMERARRNQIEERWRLRQQRFKQRDHAKAEAAKREAPESIEELIVQRVPPEQIAKMKGVDADIVRRMAAEMGVALDGHTLKFADPTLRAMEGERARDVKQQQQFNQAAIDTHPEAGDRDARILAMHLDELKPAAIAAALQREFPGLSPQAVGRVIKAAESEPAAA